MKKLNDALSTRTNSRASKRSRNSNVSSSSSKGSQQSSSRSSSKENISSKVPAAKINVQMHIPSYDGTKGKASSFVQNFLEVMTVNKIESACWGPFLLDCLKRDALSFYKSQKRKHETMDSFFRSFKNFFDNRSEDDEYTYFSQRFRQQEHEDYDKWYLRYETEIQNLQLIGVVPDDSDPSFKKFYMREFLSKLNSFCFTIVDKKLKDIQKHSWKFQQRISSDGLMMQRQLIKTY